MPKPFPSSDDTGAMIERVAPAVLTLLADGVPRSKRAIAAELAAKHPKDEIVRTLMRLAVTAGWTRSAGSTRSRGRRSMPDDQLHQLDYKGAMTLEAAAELAKAEARIVRAVVRSQVAGTGAILAVIAVAMLVLS